MVFLSIELALIAPQRRDSIKTKRECDGKTADFRFQPFRFQLLTGAAMVKYLPLFEKKT
jgi:hypothetical protein